VRWTASPKARWALLLGGALAWRLLFFIGPQASDDQAYSDLAQAIRTGTFHLSPNIFSTRLGYLASIALGYGLFGAGPFTLVLPNLAFSMAGIVLAFLLTRELLDERRAWAVALLTAAAPPDVFLATEAHTDLPLAVLFSAALLLYLRAMKSGRTSGFLLAGLALGVAHLFKESAFFGLAAVAAVAAKLRRQDGAVVAGFAAVVLAESVGLGLATGDPLYRLHSVRSSQAGSIAALEGAGGMGFLRPLLALLEFVDPSSQALSLFGLLPLLALGGVALALRTRSAPLLQCTRWMSVLILLSVFWPITLVPYRPALWNHPRIFAIAEVPMAILAVALLDRATGWPRRLGAFALAASFVLCTVTLHADARRTTAGARLAFDGPLRSGAEPVVADPRTTYLFRLYDGYRDTRPWRDWGTLGRGELRVVNDAPIRNLRQWYGFSPPPGFEPAGTEPIRRILVPARVRLRPLLLGRVERVGDDEVRIYSVP
jgi:4-amino-4-deoxy-L-arabinose transferase-like glycosyltransferase